MTRFSVSHSGASALLIAAVLFLSISNGASQSHRALADDVSWLERRTESLLKGCQMRAHDGTALYTPDGKANYAALWTRDFAYMVENAGDLVPLGDVEACLVYLMKQPRRDGAIPDRVQTDGMAVYVGGSPQAPLGEANLDNPMFLVIAVDEFFKLRAETKRQHSSTPTLQPSAFFAHWSGVLDRGMDWVPRSEHGLVYNNPEKPHSPYGFTDTVGKTGELLFESLLYWTACQRMEKLHRRFGEKRRAGEYNRRAELIEKNLARLWSEDSGAFLAASKDCRQIDVWGNAYAVYLKFPLGRKKDQIVNFLARNYDRYVLHGQVRHLLAGEYWQRLLIPIERERYQNGAYWATASGWLMTALAQKHPALSKRVFTELVQDFRQNGVFECINKDYRQLDSYVASAANPLKAARDLYR